MIICPNGAGLLNKMAALSIYGKQEGQDGLVSLTLLPNKSELFGLSVQENKFNIDCQDGGHFGFPVRTILATFDLQIT